MDCHINIIEIESNHALFSKKNKHLSENVTNAKTYLSQHSINNRYKYKLKYLVSDALPPNSKGPSQIKEGHVFQNITLNHKDTERAQTSHKSHSDQKLNVSDGV